MIDFTSCFYRFDYSIVNTSPKRPLSL